MELQRLCISYAGRRNSGTWELYQRENQSSLSLSVPDESKREDLLKKEREGERERDSVNKSQLNRFLYIKRGLYHFHFLFLFSFEPNSLL